jgi:hypothetical protein
VSCPTNRRLYDAALDMVARGVWRVDPDEGAIYGRGDHRIGFRRPAGGYALISVVLDGVTKVAYQHRVIYEAVHGPTADGLEVNHINGDKADNRIANLEVVTPSGNMSHALRTGLIHRKLTKDQVGDIRRRYAGPIKPNREAIAAEFGVRPRYISDVVYGRRWERDGASPSLPSPRG